VLAALLVDAGRPVTLDTLVDRVWGDMPPDGARHALHTYLGRIRRLLADLGDGSALVHRSGVYVLDIDPDRVDLHRFRRLLDHARDPQCHDRERATRGRPGSGRPAVASASTPRCCGVRPSCGSGTRPP
jgi:DNA-binding SARP family transcriptional activator